MKKSKNQKKLGAPVMKVPEKRGCRIGNTHAADRFVSLRNIVGNGQKNTRNNTNQQKGNGYLSVSG
jgi:hypothetical protein